MDNMSSENDNFRINMVKLFKHFGESKMPVTENVFIEYCNLEGITDVSFEQYEERLLDWKEDQVVKETLPHIFRILAENADLSIGDFDLESKVEQTAANINKVQGEIAHLLKRSDVPYNRHGDIMYRITRIFMGVTEQATETNRKDVESAIEDMAQKKFGHELNMADIALYHQNEFGK